MERIEYLAHTADIRMLIEASSPELLFPTALKGMNTLLHQHLSTSPEPGQIDFQVHLDSLDTTTLLIDFLSEVLTESHTRKAVFSDLSITQFAPTSLTAILKGFRVEHFDEDIKAVTYHEAEVKQNATGNWQTVVIFDI